MTCAGSPQLPCQRLPRARAGSPDRRFFSDLFSVFPIS
jgi:hypothetical protein